MKKKLLFITILIIFASLSTAAMEKAVIKSFKGKVEVKTGSSWEAVEKGMELKPGSIISTGFKSNAVIETGSSEIFVKQLTRM